MKSQTLRAKPERSAPAFVDRTVTLLGATGSIGASTIDLLKRQPRALSRRGGQRHIATPPRSPRWRASSARASRRSAILPPMRELKDALAGTGIEAGAGESALIEAAAAPG